VSRVLVTGASGFIGRHAVTALAERGFEVHVAGRGSVPGVPLAATHRVDLLAPDAADAVIRAVAPSHLVHLAWYDQPGAVWTSTENVRWVEASLALVRAFAAAGGRRLVMAGTCAEYDWAHGFCSEGVTPLAPATLYGRSKHALHTVVAGLADECGLSLAWARVFFVYGPHEHPSRLVAGLVRSLLGGEPARLSEGSQLRDFLHVEDVGEAFAALADCDVKGPVNVGSGAPTSVRAIAELAGELTARPELLHFGAIPMRPGDPPLVLADRRRLATEVGFTPRFTLRAGLEDTIAWWGEAT